MQGRRPPSADRLPLAAGLDRLRPGPLLLRPHPSALIRRVRRAAFILHPSALILVLALPCLLLAQYVEDSIDVGGASYLSCHNPNRGLVYGYLGHLDSSLVFAIDCSTNEVRRSVLVPDAFSLVYDSTDNKLYCLSRYFWPSVDSVFVFDGTTLDRIGHVPLTLRATAPPVWDPSVNRLYLAEHTDNSVAVVDCSADTVITHVPTSVYPGLMHLNTRHRKLYVRCWEELCIIDLRTLQLSKTMVLPGGPEDGGCYSEAADKYYTGAGPNVVVVDGAADTITRVIPTHVPISAVSVEAHGLVMVGCWSLADSFYVIDAHADTIVRTFLGIRAPYGLYWSEATDMVYCTSNQNKVVVVAGDGSRIVTELQVGSSSPTSIAAAPQYRRLYVNGSKVYVIRDIVSSIAETQETRQAGPLRPTILTRAQLQAELLVDPSLSLFDASGRRILSPRSGVFFLRSPSATRKVLLTRW